MKNLACIAAVAALGMGLSAEARPFSTTEELAYLKTTLGTLAQVEGYQLEENSLTLEPADSKPYLRNFSPTKMINNRMGDDRSYYVFFRLKNNVGLHDVSVYFMTATFPYCLTLNNTTVRIRSALSNQENCMAISLSSNSDDLGRQVTASALMKR